MFLTLAYFVIYCFNRITNNKSQKAIKEKPEETHKTTRATASTSEEKTVITTSETQLVTTHLVLRENTDGNGFCSGGQLLCWIDIAAGLAASTVSRYASVTASVDAVHFLEPSREGEVVIISAMINRTFRTSMEVGVRVETENLNESKARRYCCSAYLSFVGIDAQGKSIPVHQVVPETESEKRRFEMALERRQKRLSQSKLEKAKNEVALLSPQSHKNNEQVHSCDVKNSHTRITMKAFPQHANTVGVTFGGYIMEWIQHAAYISAARFAHNNAFVLVSVDSLTFHSPTRVGDTIHIVSQVSNSFESSVEVYVSVYKTEKNMGFSESVYCNGAFLTLVQLDENKKPKKGLPQAVFSSDLDRERAAHSIERKNKRNLQRSILKRPENAISVH